MPDDCSLEDIQYHLYVIQKVRNGLEIADNQWTLSQEEVAQQLGKWLTECGNYRLEPRPHGIPPINTVETHVGPQQGACKCGEYLTFKRCIPILHGGQS